MKKWLTKRGGGLLSAACSSSVSGGRGMADAEDPVSPPDQYTVAVDGAVSCHVDASVVHL